jgi:hypothetical protein
VEFSGSDNFVSQNEASLACENVGQRILQETTMECLPGADDSDMCLASEILPTPAPSTYGPAQMLTFPPIDAGPPADVGSPSSSAPPNEQPSGPPSNSTSSDCESYKSKKGKSSMSSKGSKGKCKGKKGKEKKSCKKGSKKFPFKKNKELKKSKKGKGNKKAVVHGNVGKPTPKNTHKTHANITQGHSVLSIAIEGDGSFAQPGKIENP